jgi:hypothetical protein
MGATVRMTQFRRTKMTRMDSYICKIVVAEPKKIDEDNIIIIRV